MSAIDALAVDLAGRQPEPSSAAPQMLAAAAGQAAAEPAAAELVGFNPEIHETGPDGGPIPRADGKGFKLKRGRGSLNRKAPRIFATDAPPDFAASQAPSPRPMLNSPGVDIEPIEVKAKRCAKDGADTFFEVAVSLLSDEWQPEPAERERIERALERVYIRYGCLDLPPGIALVLAVGMYAAKRSLTAQLLAPLIGKLFGGGDAAAAPITEGLSKPGFARAA